MRDSVAKAQSVISRTYKSSHLDKITPHESQKKVHFEVEEDVSHGSERINLDKNDGITTPTSSKRVTFFD